MYRLSHLFPVPHHIIAVGPGAYIMWTCFLAVTCFRILIHRTRRPFEITTHLYLYSLMEYRPRYSQPFTLGEAVRLDVSTITEEITRLQNSIRLLKETQSQLEEVITSDPDEEFVKAFDDNKLVIGSQEERISILKMALTEKGIHMGSHYDLPPRSPPTSQSPGHSSDVQTYDNGGIDL